MRKGKGDVFGSINRGDGRTTEVVESLGRLDLDNLVGESTEIGAESIWFGEVAARAKKAARDLRMALEVARANAGKHARLDLVGRGERVTDAHVKELTDTHPSVLTAHAAWSQAEYEADLAESAKYAIARKHDHVKELTGLLTQEMGARSVRRQPV